MSHFRHPALRFDDIGVAIFKLTGLEEITYMQLADNIEEADKKERKRTQQHKEKDDAFLDNILNDTSINLSIRFKIALANAGWDSVDNWALLQLEGEHFDVYVANVNITRQELVTISQNPHLDATGIRGVLQHRDCWEPDREFFIEILQKRGLTNEFIEGILSTDALTTFDRSHILMEARKRFGFGVSLPDSWILRFFRPKSS